MENLPADLCLNILCLLDHQDLVTAQQVCRKWKLLASENDLWSNLFEQRWGIDRAIFYAPTESKSWKDVYAVQDRCDRVGLGLKIIREGDDYFLIHQGEIQRHLGSRSLQLGTDDVSTSSVARYTGDELMGRNDRQMGILDRILFFIGDLETASAPAKRGRLL
ncbi:F-box protein SKIP31-like [Cynara cardunculus var. scolymus]|uniref:F-box protein SKIP31-like n=1 Tax=Cynara cardunculus var. scolymus TaxID=59895 RepID=UPI000D62352D|nr:F-box protein SKIP31-like [Cynara cardunculus var. scolymus]